MMPYERIMNTLEGKEVDRLPVMDIIHNIDFIEYLTNRKITKANAEDLTCEAIKSKLDLCRHVTIPDPENIDDKEFMDEDGFVIKNSW